MTREEKALAHEAEQFRKAGWVERAPRPSCYPYVELPPQSKWLSCWKKVFGITKGAK